MSPAPAPDEFQAAFGRPPSAAARAPGRVNLIGEHTDYNGGLVLPAAISLDTAVWVRFNGGDRVRGVSRELGPAEAGLEEGPRGEWLDYVRGVGRGLAEEGRVSGRRGYDVLVQSSLPVGAGLSSSAALEVAAALALAAAAGAPFADRERPELARLCQRAEAGFAGVPCGIMDPYASACAGDSGALLLDCASLAAEPVPLPRELALLVVDTGVRRRLGASAYADRRRECAAALARARRVLGRPLGSLSEIAVEELDRLAGGMDGVGLRRAAHVVRENARVRAFAGALRAGDPAAAGELLYASHASLAANYDASWPEADRQVAASRELPGVHGARMIGAGWGGCTLHLIDVGSAGADAPRRLGAARHWRVRPAPPASLIA